MPKAAYRSGFREKQQAVAAGNSRAAAGRANHVTMRPDDENDGVLFFRGVPAGETSDDRYEGKPED